MSQLTIGTRVANHDNPVTLNARKFNRHTFWCGQSGSGKSYALGVLLEQLLLHTELPMLILDPNADFARIRRVRETADAASTEAINHTDIRVFHSTSAEEPRLKTRYVELSVQARAAVLQLDPIEDAEEYNALLHSHHDPATTTGTELLTALSDTDSQGQARLATRVDNLQVLSWDLWSWGGPSVTDTIDERPRMTVMDLGGFAQPEEPKVAALAALEHLWRHRHERKPILIVIDEAHNICSPDPVTALDKALTEQVIQIAAEGRKFGLWLLLSTQRPTKIHPNVLSQCDNLALMRVNAPRDLDEITEVFGFAPQELIRRAQSFSLGQGLFAGSFVDEPTVVQMGQRLTEEAGGDVSVPLPAADGVR